MSGMWIDRLASTRLRQLAATFPAVLVTGARQAGKTPLCVEEIQSSGWRPSAIGTAHLLRRGGFPKLWTDPDIFEKDFFQAYLSTYWNATFERWSGLVACATLNDSFAPARRVRVLCSTIPTSRAVSASLIQQRTSGFRHSRLTIRYCFWSLGSPI